MIHALLLIGFSAIAATSPVNFDPVPADGSLGALSRRGDFYTDDKEKFCRSKKGTEDEAWDLWYYGDGYTAQDNHINIFSNNGKLELYMFCI